eukprot:scaffold3108_cov152-Cylindrotheca_fusiformis.AAC.17
MQQISLFILATALLSLQLLFADAFTPSPLFSNGVVVASSPTVQFATPTETAKGYTPKWKKKSTLAEEQGSINDLGFENVGIKGTIPVVFKQGNDTRTSMAFAGQPLRDVATQAGQYIKYGCGKGECGTCECMVNGKWIRPCVATVPSLAAGDEYSVQLKAITAKSASSGTFFSLRSFIMGFWNNLLGMVGFVKMRRAARKNWEERQSYEDRVAQRTKEIRAERLANLRLSDEPTAPEAPNEREATAPPPVKCPDCDLCDGSGRIVGGLGAVLPWLPVKAYRPCPNLVERGGSYSRSGQGLDEIAFGRDSTFKSGDN